MESSYIKKISVEEMYEKRPRIYLLIISIILLFLIIMSWASTVYTSTTSNSVNSLSVAKSIIEGIINPDFSLLFSFNKEGVLFLLLETLSIAFLATLFGAFLSIPFAFLGATNILPKLGGNIFRFAVVVIRTIPSFVYALIFIRVTGPGASAGILTLSFSSIGTISKTFTENIENLDKRMIETMRATGLNTFQIIRYCVIPQIMPDFISSLIYRFEMNLRDSTVLGFVGAGGIGAPLVFAITSHKWNEAGSILIGLVLLILFIEYLSSCFRNKLARGIY